jgi:FMN phosphatase YigB (HAD superfamily)
VIKDSKSGAGSKREFDAIILDLGGVIVPLDYGLTQRLFEERFVGISSETFCGGRNQDKVFNLFETGEMDAEEFRLAFRDRAGNPADPVWFRDAWNAMILSLPPERVEWLRRLGDRTRLFLYSNINALHFDYLNHLYEGLAQGSFSDLFEKAYYSHLFGMRKPHPEGFRRIIAENGLTSSRTLFVDDGLHHVEGARTAGLRAEHLKSPEKIEQLIRRIGVME